MEFFNNVWQWIQGNIVPLLTTTNIAMVLGLILSFVRSKKALISTGASAGALEKELKETKKANAELTQKVSALEASQNRMSEQSAELLQAQSHVLNKLDGILAVQDLAYSASKAIPQDTLATMKNTINNVRYAATKTRKDIADNVDEATKIIDTAVTAAKESLKKTKQIVQPNAEENTKPKQTLTF